LTKSIETLIEDVQKVLLVGPEEISDQDLEDFGKGVAALIKSKLQVKQEKYLRFSNMGSPCERKLWYQINRPDEQEELTADTKLKFLFGDLTELLLLFLAKIAGHKVEGGQTQLDLHGIKGSRDAVIDGVVVDVKSTSSFSFKKFNEHTLKEDDAFGYIPQLLGYLEASQEDDIVLDKSRAAFWAFDKSLGHMCLDFHARPNWDWKAVIEYKQKTISLPEPPERAFEPVEFGKSGNMKLGSFCSYCSAKELCYPGLRTFIYSTGPVYLTEVESTPNVYEVPRASDTG